MNSPAATVTRSTLLMAALSLCGAAAHAAVSQISLADFSSSALVADFNVVAEEAPVADTYAPLGLHFSGNLYGLTNDSDTFHDGTTIASTWIYSSNSSQGPTWSVSFDALQQRAGFFASVNLGDSFTVTLFRGAASLGSLTLAGSIDYNAPGGPVMPFVGFAETGGFDRLAVTTSTTFNGYFGMDDFRSDVAAPVPEPAPLLMFTAALGLGWMRFRRRP